MPLPVNSTLTLQGQPRPGDVMHPHYKPKQAMLVRMSAETLEAMGNLQNPPKIEFNFGDKPGIYIGDTFYPVKANGEAPHHELYLRLPSAQKPMAPLKLYANVIGKFMVERQLGNKVEETVRDRTLEAEKQRTERKTVFLDGPPDLKHPAKTKKKTATTTARRTVPSTNHAASSSKMSPLPPSTSHASASPSEVAATRARLIHCLALKARTTDVALLMCGGKEPPDAVKAEIMTLLRAVAEPVRVAKSSDPDAPQRWQLRLQSWTEVRPYEWPRLTPEERLNLSRQARKAFNSLKIPESDPIWEHVRYRADPTDSAAGSTVKAGARANGPVAEKNGVMSKNTKKVKTAKRVADIAIPSKDESGKGKAHEVDEGSAAGTPTSTTSLRPPVRRPGSGFKKKPSTTPPLDDPRANSPPPPIPKKQILEDTREGKREPSGSTKPPTAAESRSTSVAAGAAQIRKKARDSQGSSNGQRATEDRREDRPRQRDYAAEEKQREKGPASPAPAPLPSFKRKKPPQDGNDSEYSERELPLSAGAAKKRKLDDPPTPADKARARTLNVPLPKKPVDREPSPLAPPRVKIKKEASPLSIAFSPPRPLAAEKHDSAYSPRPTGTKTQRTAGKDRRRRTSPIYTTSEDEESVARVSAPAKRAKTTTVTGAGDVGYVPARFKPCALPADRAGLRKYYRACYEVYFRVFEEQTRRRNRIRRMLRRAEEQQQQLGGGGGAASADGSEAEMDVEELAPEGIMALMDDLGAVTDELHKVRQAWERLGGKVDSSGELVDE